MPPRHAESVASPELESPAPPAPPTREALAQAAGRLGVAPHVLAGVRGLRRWDDLFPVTDDELLAAVVAFESITLG